jgi:hypothetical protein
MENARAVLEEQRSQLQAVSARSKGEGDPYSSGSTEEELVLKSPVDG